MRLLSLLLAALGLILPATVGLAAQPVTTGAIQPADGPIVAGFEPGPTPYSRGHRGVDIAARPGAAVRAAASGTIAFAGSVAGRGWVSIDHGAGIRTSVGHLIDIAVEAGEAVDRGQHLGRLGPDRDHLHWGARLGEVYIDPLLLLAPARPHLRAIDGVPTGRPLRI